MLRFLWMWSLFKVSGLCFKVFIIFHIPVGFVKQSFKTGYLQQALLLWASCTALQNHWIILRSNIDTNTNTSSTTGSLLKVYVFVMYDALIKILYWNANKSSEVKLGVDTAVMLCLLRHIYPECVKCPWWGHGKQGRTPHAASLWRWYWKTEAVPMPIIRT